MIYKSYVVEDNLDLINKNINLGLEAKNSYLKLFEKYILIHN